MAAVAHSPLVNQVASGQEIESKIRFNVELPYEE
jgi:hypothetical protein